MILEKHKETSGVETTLLQCDKFELSHSKCCGRYNPGGFVHSMLYNMISTFDRQGYYCIVVKLGHSPEPKHCQINMLLDEFY